MNLELIENRNRANEITNLEDCIHYDLGLPYNKKSKLIENTCRENWKSLASFGYTNDGMQIDDITTNDCIVYVSFHQVISSLEIFEAENDIELWMAINRAIYSHFFDKEN